MYSAFFRHLPGPKWVRVIIMIILAACIFGFLNEIAFPIVSQYLDNTESTVGVATFIR